MQTKRAFRQLPVRSLSYRATKGFLDLGFTRISCVLGNTGRAAVKREGDGHTPRGQYRVLRIYFRADRLMRPRAIVPVHQLNLKDGWCDAPGDRNYNRKVDLPYAASAEEMWRQDHLYNVVGVLDHNTLPRVRGGGSAIFLHMAQFDWRPTAGCIAVQAKDMKRLLAVIGPKTRLIL